MKLLFALILLGPLISLHMAPSPAFTGADRIEYHYGDSSVPPPHHRSYVLSITPGQTRIVVDSYGDVLADELVTVEAPAFARIAEALQRAKIRKGRNRNLRGCTGGTSESIVVSGDTLDFSAHVYHCGGKDGGDLRGDPTIVKDAIFLEVPALQAALQSTR